MIGIDLVIYKPEVATCQFGEPCISAAVHALLQILSSSFGLQYEDLSEPCHSLMLIMLAPGVLGL